MIKKEILEKVSLYQDFPRKGVGFIDLMPLLSDNKLFRRVVDSLSEMVTASNIIAPEARGFLLSAPLLLKAERTLTVARKQGKLPFAENDLAVVNYQKEYGTDHLIYRKSDLKRSLPTLVDGTQVIEVAVLDDILATGGTALGIARSLEELSGKEGFPKVIVKEFVFLGEISFLGGRKLLESIAPVRTIVDFD